MKKISILFLILLCSCTFLYAQQFSITGVITDKKLKEPIIGASVIVKGTTNGTVTDLDGNFTLQVSKENVLVISFIGYITQEIKVNENQSSYNIQMSEDTQTLDEVVVVGFGTQRKANLTDAVATVDTKVLDSRPVSNLGQSLQGTVPGLNLSVGGLGGQLGQTMNVNIRGTGTISTGSKAATLVLIDGIEGNMNNLNPDDVESISVLKDAAASSIYGSRAAFGVILITTKKGKAGKASISYSGNARYAGPNHLPDLMNSYQFANYFNEGSINGGGKAIFDEDTMERIQQYMNGEITTSTIANANGNWQFHEKANDNVNWYKTHYKWAWSQEHNLNINGGSDKSQYYVSANYLDQDGNLRYGNDSYERISTAAPRILAYPLQSLRPILHITCPDSMISYSKGSRGLFVPSRVIGIFTDTTISLSSRLRQRPDHYTIRAGRNLPDKEFRYLRTVIVTAAVYWGFNSMLLLR